MRASYRATVQVDPLRSWTGITHDLLVRTNGYYMAILDRERL